MDFLIGFNRFGQTPFVGDTHAPVGAFGGYQFASVAKTLDRCMDQLSETTTELCETSWNSVRVFGLLVQRSHGGSFGSSVCEICGHVMLLCPHSNSAGRVGMVSHT